MSLAPSRPEGAGLGFGTLWRAGSARPEGRHHADPSIAPSWPPASRKGTGANAMPCHSSGRTVRARRPRPSERTTLHIITAFSPKGLSPTLAPPEGRAPHARKGGITLTPTLPLLGHRLLGKAPVATQCLAIRPAVPCGRGDRAPPRRPPFAPFPGLPPKGSHPGLSPAEGRAPHARKGGITLTPTLPLLGHRLLGKAPVATQCLAIRPAVPCGRGDRAPPRRPPSVSSPGLPGRGHPSLDGPPRGGAGSARPQGRHHADPSIAPSWPPASRKGTGANAMPCHSSGRTVRARGPRPSERTTPPHYPRLFSARPS